MTFTWQDVGIVLSIIGVIGGIFWTGNRMSFYAGKFLNRVENIGGAFTRFEKTFEKHMDEEQVQAKAMWTKLDAHGEKLVEHHVRIKGIEDKGAK